MSPEEAVNRTTEVMEEARGADEQKLRDMLLKRAIQPFLADQLLVLVPLAFSRAYFEGLATEKQYWNHFLLVDRRTHREEKHRLDWNPFFCAAQVRARKLSSGSPKDRERLKAVAQQSSEYQAIDNVLSQLPAGVTPQSVGTSPALVMTDFPEYNAKPAYRSTVRFREAYRGPDASSNDCALAISLVIDAEHPLAQEIRHVNECFLNWLAQRGTHCKQLVIAFEAAPDQNQQILEQCQSLLQQDLGRDDIIQGLDTDLFLIDPATKTEKHFKLAWRANS